MKQQFDASSIAVEIIRRAGLPQDRSLVISLSDPPTAQQKLQLLAATLQGRPIAVTPENCMTAEEWAERYCGADPSQSKHT